VVATIGDDESRWSLNHVVTFVRTPISGQSDTSSAMSARHGGAYIGHGIGRVKNQVLAFES
jgi:hypothetical protein